MGERGATHEGWTGAARSRGEDRRRISLCLAGSRQCSRRRPCLAARRILRRRGVDRDGRCSVGAPPSHHRPRRRTRAAVPAPRRRRPDAVGRLRSDSSSSGAGRCPAPGSGRPPPGPELGGPGAQAPDGRGGAHRCDGRLGRRRPVGGGLPCGRGCTIGGIRPDAFDDGGINCGTLRALPACSTLPAAAGPGTTGRRGSVGRCRWREGQGSFSAGGPYQSGAVGRLNGHPRPARLRNEPRCVRRRHCPLDRCLRPPPGRGCPSFGTAGQGQSASLGADCHPALSSRTRL